MPYYYGIDIWYIILVIPAMIFALIASAKVKTTFHKYSQMAAGYGLTGAEAARRVLAANGVTGVQIEQISGELTDHFDPSANVIRLSESVYGASTVAAVGVAAHEAGHAVQYAQSYAPMKLRSAIIPVTNIGSKLALPLVLLGLFLSLPTLANIGLLCFSLATLFQLLTLPVEFNASRRALVAIEGFGSPEQTKGARKVLTAAAMTYVAALATSLASLLRLVLIVNSGRSRK